MPQVVGTGRAAAPDGAITPRPPGAEQPDRVATGTLACLRGAGSVIVEGILTTVDHRGQVNVAPMGPQVVGQWEELVLRPFEGSRTLANLRATGRGVFHVVDDAELVARCAIGHREPLPPMRWVGQARGWVLQDACRWYAFEVTGWAGTSPREQARGRIIARGRQRDFLGWNRARHAVVEAAIAATRVHLLPVEELQQLFRLWAPMVWKTGGERERRAFALLVHYVEEQTGHRILDPDSARELHLP